MRYKSENFMTPDAIAIVMEICPNISVKKAQELYLKTIDRVLTENKVFHISDIKYGAGYSLVKRVFKIYLLKELEKRNGGK